MGFQLVGLSVVSYVCLSLTLYWTQMCEYWLYYAHMVWILPLRVKYSDCCKGMMDRYLERAIPRIQGCHSITMMTCTGIARSAPRLRI